jgi:hypothetical protein
VDYIGKVILSKLMNDWKLMHELAVLRAIYLLGSGDLLQHFLTVIFDRLGKGESSNDDFELNIILQVTRFGVFLRDTALIFIVVITSKMIPLVNCLLMYPCSVAVYVFIHQTYF